MRVRLGNDRGLRSVYDTNKLDVKDAQRIKEKLTKPGWQEHRLNKTKLAQAKAISAKKPVTLPTLNFLKKED